MSYASKSLSLSPSWPTLPYIPERTYATASPTAIKMPSSFCAPFLVEEMKLKWKVKGKKMRKINNNLNAKDELRM